MMNKIKKLFAAVALGITMMAAVPQISQTVNPALIAEAAGTTGVSRNSVEMTVGSKLTLAVQVNGVYKKAKWSTSNKKIATVSSSGVVTAKKAGTAKIKAKVGKKTLTCTVKVKNAAPVSAKSPKKQTKNAATKRKTNENAFYSTATPKNVNVQGNGLSTFVSKIYYSNGQMKADIFIMNRTGKKIIKLADYEMWFSDQYGRAFAYGCFAGNVNIPVGGYQKFTVAFFSGNYIPNLDLRRITSVGITEVGNYFFL